MTMEQLGFVGFVLMMTGLGIFIMCNLAGR